MLIKSSASIPTSEITDKRVYMDRRTFMRSATALATAGAVLGADALVQASQPAANGKKLENVRASSYSTDERPNTWVVGPAPFDGSAGAPSPLFPLRSAGLRCCSTNRPSSHALRSSDYCGEASSR
jgi:hypothetical protein